MTPSAFRLTRRAYEDLKNIARFTRRQWGEAQRRRYLAALDARLHWLAEHPQLGKHRPDVAEGYYCFPQGAHLIFHQMSERGGIDIIGVLHRQMDPARQL